MGSGDPSHHVAVPWRSLYFWASQNCSFISKFCEWACPTFGCSCAPWQVTNPHSNTFWVEGKTNEAKRYARWVVNYENYAKRKKKIKEEASGKIHLPHQPSTYIMTQPIFVLMPKKPKVSSIIYFDFTVVSYCRRKDRRRRHCKATSVSRKHFVIIRI